MELRGLLVAAAVGALASGWPADIERLRFGILTGVEEEGGDQLLVWLS